MELLDELDLKINSKHDKYTVTDMIRARNNYGWWTCYERQEAMKEVENE